VSDHIVEALRANRKIEAIKLYRQATGVGLKEAKEFIEEVQRRAGMS
jgi:ribosomal protein L7/L12